MRKKQDIGQIAQIDYFINMLEEMDTTVIEVDYRLWISMVGRMVVHSKDNIG